MAASRPSPAHIAVFALGGTIAMTKAPGEPGGVVPALTGQQLSELAGEGEVSEPRLLHPVGWHAPPVEPQQGDLTPVAQSAVHHRLGRRFR
jgi:hypothetical protein